MNYKLNHLPLFDAKFKGDLKTYQLPLSDHEPIAIHTAAGLIVTLNIWCPGTLIAPPIAEKFAKKKARLDETCYQTQMESMAEYLFSMVKEGAVGFMLQEAPTPGSKSYEFFVNKFNKLSSKYSKNNSLFPKFSIENWSQTSEHAFGTCSIINSSLLSSKSIYCTDLNNRGGHYELRSKTNSNIKFELYNIHADYRDQNNTALFIIEKVQQGAMVLGDFNIEVGSNAHMKIAQTLTPSDYNKIIKAQDLNTIDGFFDPYTPKIK